MEMIWHARNLPRACAGGSIFDMLTRDDRASWRAKASYILEGIHATIAITVVTFVALFMDDFRLAALPPQLDVSCEYITGLIFVWPPHPDPPSEASSLILFRDYGLCFSATSD